MSSTRRALLFSFIDRYSGLFIHTAAAMIIARLLNPAQIGVYSIVMVLVSFVTTFRDLGAGTYLIRRHEVDTHALRATFTMQVSLGLLLATIVALSAVPVVWFYHEPQMKNICFVVSLNFLVTPWLAYPTAFLTRKMQFGTLAIVRFSGALAHAGTAIGLVLAGFGAISLAWANLLTTVASLVVISAVSRLKLPHRPTRKGLKEVISFGGQITAISLLQTFQTNAIELSLGRLQGMSVAGYFSRAQGLVGIFDQLVMQAVGAVTFPFFSKQLREDQELSGSFVSAISLVTGVGWSFLAGLALCTYPLMRLLYGPQWDTAIEPARWLALASAFALPTAICQPLMLASGAMRSIFLITSFSSIATLFVAIEGGKSGIVFSSQLLCIVSAVCSALWIHVAVRIAKCTYRDTFRAFGSSFAITLFSAIPPATVDVTFGWKPATPNIALATSITGAAIFFLFAVWYTKHPIWNEVINRGNH